MKENLDTLVKVFAITGSIGGAVIWVLGLLLNSKKDTITNTLKIDEAFRRIKDLEDEADRDRKHFEDWKDRQYKD